MTDLAREYGTALFELAAEEQKDQELLQELQLLCQQFQENPKYLELLGTPTLSKPERLHIVDEALKGKVDGYLISFLKILIERGAVQEFSQCAQQYEKQYHKVHHIARATAVTAVPLTEELSNRLRDKLQQVTGKTILLSNRVDPAVLGGVSIEMDGKLMDDSLRTRLAVLRENLLQTIV